MSYKLLFDEKVLDTFLESQDFYGRISEQLATRFHDDFWQCVEYLKQNPNHFQTRYKSIRIAHLSSFPFGIHFFIDQDVIKVLRLLHHKQYYE